MRNAVFGLLAALVAACSSSSTEGSDDSVTVRAAQEGYLVPGVCGWASQCMPKADFLKDWPSGDCVREATSRLPNNTAKSTCTRSQWADCSRALGKLTCSDKSPIVLSTTVDTFPTECHACEHGAVPL